MKLKSANIQDVKLINRNSDNYATLMEFIDSDMTCAEVTDFGSRTAAVCATSLRNSVTRYHLNNVIVTKRGDRVYLIKRGFN